MTEVLSSAYSSKNDRRSADSCRYTNSCSAGSRLSSAAWKYLCEPQSSGSRFLPVRSSLAAVAPDSSHRPSATTTLASARFDLLFSATRGRDCFCSRCDIRCSSELCLYIESRAFFEDRTYEFYLSKITYRCGTVLEFHQIPQRTWMTTIAVDSCTVNSHSYTWKTK